jgi:hypothetical protein
MSPQLVFLTLFLGLISGRNDVDLQAGPEVKSIRLLLDGHQIAAMKQPPWHATVDFGPAIVPGELVAAGYDAQGNEIGRVAQTLNLPRPTAEFVIALQNDAGGTPRSAALRWEHLLGAKPVRSSLTVDGKPTPLDSANSARLPRLDMNHPHVIAAEMKFDDGFSARRELIAGGAVSYNADTQLTPVAVREQAAVAFADTGDCFMSAGSPVRVAAIENGPALVIFVLDPDPQEAIGALSPARNPAMYLSGLKDVRHLVPLDSGTRMRILWPFAKLHKTTSKASAFLFPPSNDVEASEGGLVWLLTRTYGERVDESEPRRVADAVGVAGIEAITRANRRAVVLALSRFEDKSSHDAASVRKYLASIGVPLFVWSFTGPRPELHETWGEIDDVSSHGKLKIAAARLRAELASQRVAWIAADPVAALRITSTGHYGITPVAAAR